MSVAENLKMGCYTLPTAVHGAAIDRVTGSFPMLRQKWRTDAGNLSGGEQQILEMAMVLLVEPTLLLPTSPRSACRPRCRATSSPPCSALPRAASPCWWSSRTCAAPF